MICFQCQKETGLKENVGRRDVCPHCGADAKVCLNCEFHDKRLENECREPKAERVVEKNRSNFCDLFSANKNQLGEKAGLAPIDLKAKAEALFKKK